MTATACLGRCSGALLERLHRTARPTSKLACAASPHRFTPKTNEFAATALALVSSTLLNVLGAGSSSAVRIAGFALTACLSVYGAGGSRRQLHAMGFAIVLVAVADVVAAPSGQRQVERARYSDAGTSAWRDAPSPNRR